MPERSGPLSLSVIGLAATAAYFATYLLIPLVRRLALSSGCVARPQQDRWGSRVVPRLGGLPIALSFLVALGWGAFQDARLIGLATAGFLILVTGLVDDFKCIHPNVKLTAQVLASCVVLLSGISVNVVNPWLAIPLTIGWLVLIMNAFNLMDNMDGLSAGIGAIAAGFLAWYAFQAGRGTVAIAAASLVGATLGFLRYNLPPAKIFMGDSGSQILGLGLGALCLMETWKQGARLLGILALPTLLLAVPIFDTCFVTVQRLMHGRHPFQGGTDHLSHRLGLLGLTPRQVVFTLYGLTGIFGAFSLFAVNQNPLAIGGTWLLAIGVLMMVGAYLARVRVYTGSEPPLENRVTWIETMLLHKRRLLEAAVDLAFIYACYVLAHALRFEGNFSPDLEVLILQSLPWVIAVKMLCFLACGLYRGIWRYISLSDLVNILKAVILGSVLSSLVVLYLWRFEGYSRAVFIIDGTLLFMAVSGARLVEPLLNEWISQAGGRTEQVLIVGAGDTGELVLQQLKMERGGQRRVMGFLDDDPLKRGSQIHGVRILGSRRDLGHVVKEMGISEVFIAIGRPPQDLVSKIRSYCEENGIRWRIANSPASNEATPSTDR